MALSCKSLTATRWLALQPEAVSLLAGLPGVVTRSAGDGRGLGLFASRTVPAFSGILSDSLACLMKATDDLPQLYERFLELSQAQQSHYLSLSYHDEPEKDAILTQKLLQRGHAIEDIPKRIQVGHIMRNNAFTIDIHGAAHRGLFLNVARINHSCAPNAHVNFHPPTSSEPKGRMVVHTLRELRAGEEVVISYFNILLPRTDRQAKTLKWGFACECSACDQSHPDHDEREKIRKAILDFKSEHATVMASSRTSLKALRTLSEKGSLLLSHAFEDLALRPALPDLFDELGMLEAMVLLNTKRENERQDIVAALTKSVIWEARITGSGSPATNRRLEKLKQFAAKGGDKSRPRVGEHYKEEYEVLWGPE